MKTLLILRHAKSDWDVDFGDDHARPLATRGQKGARKMGRFLTTARVVPDRALTSSAVRARETLATAAEAGGWTGPARVTDALYEASPEAVLREIQAEDDDADTLIVVGHQPTWSALVSLLIGGGRIEMKTATVARISLEVERWEDVAPGRGVLSGLLSPSDLRPNAYRKLKKTIDKAIEARQKAVAQAEKAAAPKAKPLRPASLPRGGVDATEQPEA